MATHEEQRQYPSWDDLPTDVHRLIFQHMPTSTLAVCLFVNRTWRSEVEHLLEVKNKWKELGGTNFFNFSEIKIRCKKSFDWRKMYYNYIKWHNIQKATIKLHQILEVTGIRKINVYRDHLIVVKYEHVQYYETDTLDEQMTVEYSPCSDFLENDVMAVQILKDGEYLRLLLLHKLDTNIDWIYLTKSDVLTVYNVICYKIHNNECHVLDHRNVHSMYTAFDGKWQKKILGRYYGNPDDSCAINVFDNQFYLLLKGGYILWMDQNNGNFKKMTRMTLMKKTHIEDRKISRANENSEDIHRKMFVWCYMHDVRGNYLTRSTDERDTLTVLLCSRSTESGKNSLSIERYAPWTNPMDESIIFPYNVRNVSCMLLHADVLFLGHLDGSVELISTRDLSRDLSNTGPLRRFNIRDFKKEITELAIISIEVYEDEHVQHMYIATKNHILHIKITHNNCEDYYVQW